MLRWLEDYYVGKGITAPKELQAKIMAGKAVPGVHLLTLSDHKHHIMEIIPALLLLQKHAVRKCPLIIGMAGSKRDALELTKDIITKVYQETGGFDLSLYIQGKEM